jgi:hypothetical protein
MKVLRARDGATVAKRQLSAGVADLLRWSPDSSKLAIFLHNSNDLQLLDMPEARPIRTTRINDYLGPELAAFAPDGKVLATSHYRATKQWNVEDGKLLHALPESYYMASCWLPAVQVAKSPCGAWKRDRPSASWHTPGRTPPSWLSTRMETCLQQVRPTERSICAEPPTESY